MCMQAERLAKQSAVRSRLWQAGKEHHAPALMLAATLLRVLHAVGNHTKTAVLTTLLLFKVRCRTHCCSLERTTMQRPGDDR